ncbi:MAG: long-chain acyl-CoA synthetase [Dinoroseobacter sp.]|jgi:long-chain acyl-CoA synthetase
MTYDVHQYASKGFRPLVSVVSEHAASHPDGVAMRQKRHGIWQELTWSGLDEVTQALAAGLIGLGVYTDTHLGILSENRQEWVLAQFGIQAAGGTVVGMYPTSPAAEIDHLVNASDTEILFIEDQEQFDKIVDLDGKLPKLRKLIVFEPKGLKGETYLDLTTFDDLLSAGRAALSAQRATIQARIKGLQEDATAMMVFTSGSTGLPKAAEISHANLHAAAGLAAQYFGDYPPGTNILSYLPLCHIAEQNVTVVNSLSGQFTMNFGESLRTITLDLRDAAPQIFFGVPRIWEKMQAGVMVQAQTSSPLRRKLILLGLKTATERAKTPRKDWSAAQRLGNTIWDALVYRHIRSYLGLGRCTFGITAAAPISLDLLIFLRSIGINVREAWGMSETSGAACIQPNWGASEGRCGKFLPDVQYKIEDDGELLVKGGIIFKGYYKNAKATAEAFDGAWLRTGDVAEAASDGSISIVDRKKDIMINAAGKNLAPSLIENTMKASPFIKEAIVIADRRPYVTALMQLDFDTMRLWAEGQGIAYTTFRSLAEHPKVIAKIDREVAKRNELLARVEQIKKVWLLPKELDHDDGEVTATMKVRRSKIYEIYGDQIEGLYADKVAA